jgi:hypothetical protein
MNNLTHALSYASIGWHVFPCHPTDKKPMVAGGFNSAVTDEQQIREWWAAHPKAGIGVACLLSGLFVIDLDKRPDKGRDGVRSWDALCDDHGGDGSDIAARTPSGGRHIVYKHPGSERITTRDNIVPDTGIDVRGDGGYFIAPGYDDGREWIIGSPFDGHDASPAPDWVLSLVRAKTLCGAGESGDSAKVMPIDDLQVADIRAALEWIDCEERDPWIRVGMALKSTGAGNQAYNLWCEWSQRSSSKYNDRIQRQQWRSLREYRMNGSEITLRTLFHMAMQSGWVPSSDQQIRTESVEVPEPVDKPKGPQSFPSHLMNVPGLLGDLAEWIKDSGLREQPALALGSAIATVATILGRKVCTETNLRTNVYVIGCGETACGKEAGIAEPYNLLKAAKLEHLMGTSDWTSDAGVRASLHRSPSQLCCLDEFGKWLKKMSGERQPAHVAGVKKILMEGYSRSGGVLRGVSYASADENPIVDIVEPNLSIYGASTPADLFSALDSGAASDGWLNRFLFFFVDDNIPRMRRGVALVGPDRDDARERICAKMRQLSESVSPKGNLAGLTSDGSTKTGCTPIRFSDDARDRIEQIQDRIDDMRRKSGSDLEKDLWARGAAHIAKLALIHAASVASEIADTKIEIHDVEWAECLVSWCLDRTCLETAGRMGDNRIEQTVLKIKRLIEDRGSNGVSGSMLSRKTRWVSRSERAQHLATLIEGGDIVPRTVSTNGRPCTTYYGAGQCPSEAEGT